jgi:D-inositol-3-phosphate glycosyltransferase
LLGYKKYLTSSLQRLPYQFYDCLTLKTSARRAQAVVVSSKLEYADALEFGIDKRKIHIIPMGIDAIEEVDRAGANEELRLLFVGRIARVRRVELILQAVQKLSIPWKLTVVGGEAETASVARSGYMGELKNLCQSLEIEDRVHFAGFKNPEELRSYYQSSDVFIYASLYENFSQPLLEAAGAGLPLVTTEVGIAKEIADDGGALLAQGRPESLSACIESLQDPGLRLSMGRAAQKSVQKRFDWNTIMQSYMDLYRLL